MGDPNTQIKDCQTVELLNDRHAIDELIEHILTLASNLGLKDASIFAIRLAIEEAITNAFLHGHQNLQPNIPIQVQYKISPGEIQIAIEDQGPGFIPESLPDPTLLENLSKPSGRGVMLMKAYMSEVTFNKRGNRVKMRYFTS